MNRRGAVLSLYLIPIVAIVLVVVAMMSFFEYSNNFGEKASQNENVIKQFIFMQGYIESSLKIIMNDAAKQGFSREAVIASAEKHNLHLEGQGDFFAKIAGNEFDLANSDGKAVLTVNGFFIQSSSGTTIMKKTYDLSIETDSNGEFIRFINK